MMAALSGVCQSTVFNLLQDPVKLADKRFAQTNYPEAMELYRSALNKNPDDWQTQLKLAECYYQMKEYTKSVALFDSYLNKGLALPEKNMFHCAEAQAILKNYSEAVNYYKKCLDKNPDNEVISQKIWRLGNLSYLYEDSAHYSIRLSSVNTTSGELCPVPYKNELVFVSNRKEMELIENVNGKLNTPFYQLYTAQKKKDTSTAVVESKGFARTLKSKFNIGPVDFYEKGKRMVFVSSSEKTSDGRKLGLYFASLVNHTWKLDSSYPYNSNDYSINDVTINEDGTMMYFSSDMKGGIGGKDIYTSTKTNGKWSKPINVGELVNTTEDEAFPNLQNNTLYFSSDGHAGLGALDIFKVRITIDGFEEVENMGYPINSSYDDFGLKFDSTDVHGYFTSNRKHGGYDDDVYEFEMDMQTYPFVISGIMQYKEHTLSDQSEVKIWPNTKIFLVDSEKNLRVFETITDIYGGFSISIPYFSKYYIAVDDQSGNEYKASLELEKYRVENSVHQIVVVKSLFNSSSEPK